MPANSTRRALFTLIALLAAGCTGGGSADVDGGGSDAAVAPVSPDAGPPETPPDAAPTPDVGPAVCGDGLADPAEVCDPGGWRLAVPCSELDPTLTIGEATCTADCRFDLSACGRLGACGDGNLDAGEGCDDGNGDDFDGCSAACTTEVGGIPDDDTPPAARATADEQAAGRQVCLGADFLQRYPIPALPTQIRVKLHVTQSGPGRPAFNDVDARAVVWGANRVLERAGVELVPTGDIHLVEGAQYFNPNRAQFDDLVVIANAPDALDVYLVNTMPGSAPGTVTLGRAAGIPASRQADGTAVTRRGGAATLAHEIGHLLGLSHTHSAQAGACDRSGDQMCDTPVDPGPDFLEGDGRCADNSGARGCDCALGEAACAPSCPGGETPDPGNTMSYYGCNEDLEEARFTRQQVGRMQCIIESLLAYAVVVPDCADADGDGYGSEASPDCRRQGIDCADGDPAIHPGAVEACNRHDDDCDGRVDEDSDEACDDAGFCAAGIRRCVDGALGVCEGAIESRQEICNGVDDDCDGNIDEQVDPLREALVERCPEAGLCGGGGARQICQDGAWTCRLPVGYVAEECPVVAAACGHGDLDDPTCSDGIDNDCDGVRDEHDPILFCAEDPAFDTIGDACFVSRRGRCGRDGGSYACVQLGEGCGVGVDCVGATFPEAERCDDLDWDCDGFAANRDDRDGDGFGTCQGRLDCDEGDPSVYPGAEERCNGRDDDCDGVIDDGFPEVQCGLGICRRPIPTCAGGRPQQCDQQLARQGARAETCNGLDDDCDGIIDDVDDVAGAACIIEVQLPPLNVWPLDDVGGDTEFAGNGPDVDVAIDFRADAGRVLAHACVTMQEVDDNTRGYRCMDTAVNVANQGLVDPPAFFVHYLDNDNGWDDALARRTGRYVPHPAVATVECVGDTPGLDVCSNLAMPDCSGCRITFHPLRVRVAPNRP